MHAFLGLSSIFRCCFFPLSSFFTVFLFLPFFPPPCHDQTWSISIFLSLPSNSSVFFLFVTILSCCSWLVCPFWLLVDSLPHTAKATPGKNGLKTILSFLYVIIQSPISIIPSFRFFFAVPIVKGFSCSFFLVLHTHTRTHTHKHTHTHTHTHARTHARTHNIHMHA